MRDILFRGKRKDNGEWVCSGNLIQFFDNNIREVYISQYGERCNAVHDIDTDNIETITCKNSARFYKAIPDTVGQYTGLTDKNGKKIFEGDILNTTNSDYVICCVDSKNTAFCCNQGNANYSCVLDDFMRFSDVEVIGNIHDNLELLEVGK